MRTWTILCAISALYEAHCAASQIQEATFSNDLQGRSPNPLHFLKRQSLCPSGYSSCSSLGNSGACCPSGTNCAKDQNGNVACCPVNAVCTGVISGSAPRTSATSGFVLGGPSTTAPPTTAPATLPSGYSTVPNQYYPFVAIPTSYQNAQSCLNAYSTCQAASTSCFNSLAGQNGVTVGGFASLGVTQAGAAGSGATAASSICASLYTRGCYNLQSSVCSSFGTAAGQTTGFIQANAGPAPVRCTGAFYTAAAAVLGMGMVQAAIV